jgi:hypothetical protein
MNVLVICYSAIIPERIDKAQLKTNGRLNVSEK